MMKAKLIALGAAAVLATVIATANADEAARQAAMTRAPAAAPGPAFPEREIDMQSLCGREGDAPRYYPQSAMERGIGGDVVLDCAIGADGKFSTCQVLYHEPERHRFDRAALRIACRFSTDPATIVENQPVSGNLPEGTTHYRRAAEGEPWRARVPVRFRLAR